MSTAKIVEWVWSIGGMIVTEVTQNCPPPQIPHGLAWD